MRLDYRLPNSQSTVQVSIQDQQQQTVFKRTLDSASPDDFDVGKLLAGTYHLVLKIEASPVSHLSGASWSILGNSAKEHLFPGSDSITIHYDTQTNPDWIILSSGEIPITPQTTSHLKADLRSTQLDNRHMKVRVLDGNHQELSVSYFQETIGVPHDSKTWQAYDQDLEFPANARYMEWQVLVKARSDSAGMLEMRNVSVLTTQDLISTHLATVYENTGRPLFAQDQGNVSGAASRDGNNPTRAVVWPQSPSPLWQLRLNGKAYWSYPLNGVSTLFLVQGSGAVEIGTKLDDSYRIGLYILAGTMIALVVFLLLGRGKIAEKMSS